MAAIEFRCCMYMQMYIRCRCSFYSYSNYMYRTEQKKKRKRKERKKEREECLTSTHKFMQQLYGQLRPMAEMHVRKEHDLVKR